MCLQEKSLQLDVLDRVLERRGEASSALLAVDPRQADLSENLKQKESDMREEVVELEPETLSKLEERREARRKRAADTERKHPQKFEFSFL